MLSAVLWMENLLYGIVLQAIRLKSYLFGIKPHKLKVESLMMILNKIRVGDDCGVRSQRKHGRMRRDGQHVDNLRSKQQRLGRICQDDQRGDRI